MANPFTIDLQESFAAAFGVRKQLFIPVNTEEQQNKKAFTQQEQITEEQETFSQLPKLLFDNSSVKSTLGTMVVSPITFKGGSYKERLTDGQLINSNYEELALSPTATIEVTLNKITVETPKYGGRGTFKELTGFSDPKVTIRGFLVGEDLQRPESQIRQLLALKQVPSAIGVVCDYLSWLDIHYLVVQELRLSSLKGKPSLQPFEMICLGDEPVQLI